VGPIEGALYGLSVAVTPEHLLAALIGALAGSIIGLLPGLGPVGGAAILLPLTFTMGPTAGVIMLAGIYYGVMYGGSTTAVLLNIPGEAPSVVATFDGYPMAQKGRAGPALGIIALSSFVAGTSAVALAVFFSPYLARTALAFGPAEFLALSLGGLLLLARVTGGSLGSGLVPMGLGLLFATVGRDEVTGTPRFTFGQLEMSLGIEIVAVAIGLFGLAELIQMVENPMRRPKIANLRWRNLIPTRTDLRRSAAPWARGGGIGFGLGLLPGPSAAMSTFLSYRVEKSVSKHPERFGTGEIEGIAGPEAANNAAATSSMIPILALGIPFSATLALVLAALMAHGVTPGPLIMIQRPDIFWGVLMSMFVGNVILLFLNVNMIRVWVSALRIPLHYLVPIVLVLATFAAYAARRSMLDIIFAGVLALVGYLFAKLDFHPAPLLVGLLLGPLIEKHISEGLTLSRGDVSYFIESGLAKGIWGVVAFGVLFGPTVKLVRRLRRSDPDPEDEPAGRAEQRDG
jgi:putative tricarboxylic transport membrane protein